MAYRRKQGVARLSTPSREEFTNPDLRPPPPPEDDSLSSPSASLLAAKAIRASSAAYRDSSLSSAYGHSALASFSSPSPNSARSSSSPSSAPTDSATYVSMKSLSEPKHGFWGGLARKAKAIIDNDDAAQEFETPGRARLQRSDIAGRGQSDNSYHSPESYHKRENPALQKRLDKITSSLSYIGGTIGNALEEGLNIVENRTADIIQETRKLQMRKKDSRSDKQNQMLSVGSTQQQPLVQTRTQTPMHTDLETQLKASRDVANAMAAKAKLLLRELKTVKADLAFAKARCSQLEEENRVLRESREKGVNLEDDDLVRLQLETLLAEKARLAQENSVFARENRFLREIVEYHQLTMQDVVYLDEGSEEVTEVYPIKVPLVSNMQPVGTTENSSPSSFSVLEASSDARSPQVMQEISPRPKPPQEFAVASQIVTPLGSAHGGR